MYSSWSLASLSSYGSLSSCQGAVGNIAPEPLGSKPGVHVPLGSKPGAPWDNITGAHSSDPAVGVFTNVFLIEPRLYGVTVGVSL